MSNCLTFVRQLTVLQILQSYAIFTREVPPFETPFPLSKARKQLRGQLPPIQKVAKEGLTKDSLERALHAWCAM